MNPKSPEARNREDKPFEGMCISNTDILDSLTSRSPCPHCRKSRMYFCYTCCVPVCMLENKIPRISVSIYKMYVLCFNLKE